MNRLVLLLLCTVMLTGCAEYLAQVEEDERDKREAYFSELRDRCTQYGYKEGSEAFARCTQGEASSDEAKKRERERNFNCTYLKKEEYCDNRPLRTRCTKDYSGNLNCVTR